MYYDDTRSIPPSEKYTRKFEIQRLAGHYNVSAEDAEEHLSMIEQQKKMTLSLLEQKKIALN
jgi:hypothetical protein